MYTITLEVNKICNLRCLYCYLGEKTNQIMEEKIAYKGMDIAFKNVASHKDRKLWVDFVGGETLISFPLLKTLVNYINDKAKEKKIFVFYSLTTNGSIMNNEILNWLIKNKITLKVSIDGSLEIHDRNRKMKDGSGSYKKIIANMKYFMRYEKETKKYVQVSNVITHNNYFQAYESVKHLVENLHFRIVDSAIDVTEKWSKAQLDLLSYEWEKLICYYIDRKEKGVPILWGPIMDKINVRKQNNAFCGVGLVQIYVNVDGKIYGCAANLQESGLLGSVEKGLLASKIKELKNLGKKKELCLKCSIRDSCPSRNCVMNNLASSGIIDAHNPNICYFENKKNELWNRYSNRIYS